MISYHPTLHDQIEILKNKRSLVLNVDEIRQLIGTTLEIGVNHELKFYDDPTLSPVSNQSVLKLTPEDYERYRTFFKTLHPSVPIDGWLEDYFKEPCHRELAFRYLTFVSQMLLIFHIGKILYRRLELIH